MPHAHPPAHPSAGGKAIYGRGEQELRTYESFLGSRKEGKGGGGGARSKLFHVLPKKTGEFGGTGVVREWFCCLSQNETQMVSVGAHTHTHTH